MKGKARKMAAIAAVPTLVLSMSITAFAAGEDVSYGYLKGQQENSSRHTQFEEAAGFTTDEEREAFFEKQGIGGDGPNSEEKHLDAGELVTAGIINQETADRITAAASKKQGDLHARYSGRADMTFDELHAFYESFKSDKSEEDLINELLNDGTITKDQADAIAEYLLK